MPSSGKISIALVRPLIQVLSPNPEALAAFWAATELTAEMAADPEARVSSSQFCAAWSLALRASGDPALALRLAEGTPPGAFGIVEYVCRSAPTLREALKQWARYLGLLDESVEVGLVDCGAAIAFRVISENDAPAPASHELCFGLLVANARRMVVGRFEAVEVRFAHPAPEGHLARYRSFFDAPVSFGAERTELLIPRRIMDAPLVTADPGLLAILLPAAEALLDQGPRAPPLLDQARRALRQALTSDEAQLSDVAKRLGLTARSLQRRLQEEGKTFQALRDETRRDLADCYLEKGLSLSEISFLLGFSEPSAFFRAFKRWTGLTPIARRAMLQPNGPREAAGLDAGRSGLRVDLAIRSH